MTSSGPGFFFDGKTSARQDATVVLAPAALQVSAADGRLQAHRPNGQVERLDSPPDVLRLARPGGAVLARLDLRDPALMAAVAERIGSLGDARARSRRGRAALLGAAATAALVVAAVFAVPELATRLAPLVPQPIERRLGDAVDAQLRSMLDTSVDGGAFECGTADAEKPGRAALAKLTDRLAVAAALAMPPRVLAVRRPDPNAITLPGGRVYVFSGLIAQAQSPDELAGVLAHEFGHVARRDGTRTVLQGAGLSFLFGMVLGDFVGGGAVVLAAKSVLQSAYSREVESAADAYGVRLVTAIGADPHAFARILGRLDGKLESGSTLLADHPATAERVKAIDAAPAPRTPATLLDAAEWAALKHICI